VGIIKALLDKGMFVDLTNEYDSTALHVSATRGNLEAMKTFVEIGSPLGKDDKDSYTPLLLAAR